jgi:hypothetical protein
MIVASIVPFSFFLCGTCEEVQQLPEDHKVILLRGKGRLAEQKDS